MIVYKCDKCKKEFERKGLYYASIPINMYFTNGAKTEIKRIELCPSCRDEIANILEENGLYVQADKTYNEYFDILETKEDFSF